MRLGTLFPALAAVLSLAACEKEPPAHSLAVMDSHDHWRTVQPFSTTSVWEAASKAQFKDRSSCPPEASDIFDYYDVATPVPNLKQSGPILVGIMRVFDGVAMRDTAAAIPPGDYYHWIGKKDGIWLAGITAMDWDKSLTCSVRFAVPPDDPHTHKSIHVFTHDPEDLPKLASWAKASAAGGPQVPPRPPPRVPKDPPKTPPKEPPRKDPPKDPPKHPPEQPRERPSKRCVMVCKMIADLDRDAHYWVPDFWATK
jgi:hypothetical protein